MNSLINTSSHKSYKITQRIFVVGCPRSGTTLLQGLLAAHPRIKSFPETHFFLIAFPRNRLIRSITWPSLNTRKTMEKFLENLGRNDLQDKGQIGIFEQNYVKPFIHVLDYLTIESGKDIWVEKTPGHLNFIDEIYKQIPNAKFIHIIRNGKEVVASLYETTNLDFITWRKGKISFKHGLTIDQCIKRWNKALSITENWYKMPDHFMVSYEDLIKSPRSILKNITSFLNIGFSPDMLRNESVFDEIVARHETWKGQNQNPIQKPKNKFDYLFTEDQKEYIVHNLKTYNFQ